MYNFRLWRTEIPLLLQITFDRNVHGIAIPLTLELFNTPYNFIFSLTFTFSHNFSYTKKATKCNFFLSSNKNLMSIKMLKFDGLLCNKWRGRKNFKSNLMLLPITEIKLLIKSCSVNNFINSAKTRKTLLILKVSSLTCLMVLKKRTDMVSAMDEHEVGCPDLAFEVDSTEWILKT